MAPSAIATLDTLSAASAASGGEPIFPVVDPNAYELGPMIGCGGMGRIRAARDLRVGREIAIKELMVKRDDLVVRFVREARIAASLQHPNIVPIYEVGTWPDGTPFYTMRMIEGTTLHYAIGAAEDLAARLALLPSLIAAVDAVAYAHRCGIVHRDLTPANILCGDHGETVVIDWGLAKDLRISTRAPERIGRRFRTGITDQQLTMPGQVIGSPVYMPCEQANGLPTDERADVYSLGAILYHLFAGRPPYLAMTVKDLLSLIRELPPKPLAMVAPGVPVELARIVDRAMARDASARYSNASELAQELRTFQTELLVNAHGRRGLFGSLRALRG
jgi:serine/threonine protein kinase